MPTTLSPQQFTALYGSPTPNAAPAPSNNGLPTPTTSVAPGGAAPYQSNLPAIPQPPANLALPNPTENILSAEQNLQNNNPTPMGGTGATGPSVPQTLSAAQFQQMYGNVGASGATGATGSTGSSGGISSGLASFAKAIFGAPATLLARPVQAAAELLGANSNQVDTATNNIENAAASAARKIPVIGNFLGDTAQGLVAPVDQNFGDVEKDIGRGAETVALGLGAAPEAAAAEGAGGVAADAAANAGAHAISTPIASGALFGAGSSVANGNPLFSTQTLENTALGAAGGKLLDLVGTPLMNAAGKVIGTITPQVVKDVAAGGADAVANFMAQHQIPVVGGITKPLSEAIQTTAAGVDNGVNRGVSNLFSGAKNAALEQYPGLDMTDHFTQINQRDLTQPVRVNKPSYANATRIYNNAANRGIDIGDQLTKLGIQHDDIAEGGVYNTHDTAEEIRNAQKDVAQQTIRPAIQAAQHGVQNVSTDDVRNSIINKINNVPQSQLLAPDRQWMIDQVNKDYGPGGAYAAEHPNGYNLMDLHDSRIASQLHGGYKPNGTIADNRTAELHRYEGQVLGDLFDKKAPTNVTIDGETVQNPFKDARAEQEKNFAAANYLDSLHGKRTPQGVTQKAVRLFGRAIGGMVGSKVGGFPGFLFGSRGGDMLFNAFETFPNPLKRAILNNAFADTENPAAFDALQKYMGAQQAEALMRPRLPAGGESSAAPAAAPTLFSMSNGRVAPSLQEAVDISNAESKLKTPTTNRKLASYLQKVEQAQTNQGPYVPTRKLPVIDMGKPASSPKNLNDIKF